MARQKIGSVFKSKDANNANYVKIDLYQQESVVLKHGQYINVESKAFQLKSLAKAVSEGRITEENAEKAKARIDKMPDFVLGELFLNT